MAEIKEKIRYFVTNNIVVLVFAVICIAGYFMSGLPFGFFINDIMSRMGRNTFVVLSLIIPVLAGMGLNFAVVLGAMGGQFAIIMVTHWRIAGFGGVMMAMLLSLPINIIFGYLTGRLLNRTKGKEMIAGLILGFFALGIYQLILLVFIGTIIPMDNTEMVLSSGVGLRTSIDIGSLKYGLDNLIRVPFPYFILIAGIVLIAAFFIQFLRKQKNPSLPGGQVRRLTYMALGVVLIAWGISIFFTGGIIKTLNVPIMTYFNLKT